MQLAPLAKNVHRDFVRQLDAVEAYVVNTHVTYEVEHGGVSDTTCLGADKYVQKYVKYGNTSLITHHI